MPNDALLEEITSINAIYDPSTLEINSESLSNTVATLRVPNQSVSFLISFPSTYPDTAPRVTGTATVAEHGKGEGKAAVNLLQDLLSNLWTPGNVCLFDLIEEASGLLKDWQDHIKQNGSSGHDSEDDEFNEEKLAATDLNDAIDNDSPLDPHAAILPHGAAPPSWILSSPLTVNKSTFLAHCARCDSKALASSYVTHLFSTNKKIASATHNISAWRIKELGGVVAQDSDDDGETHAGGRLLHLIQLMDCWNCVVVVTRWYGGVKLGPDRFRCINNVAKECLVQAGFGKEGETSKKNKK